MVIIMNVDATAEDIKEVIAVIENAGLQAKVMEGSQQKIVGVIGDKARLATVPIDAMDGVEKSVEISKSYKLASREFHPQSSVIDVAGVKIGDGTPVVMAGPCAVESKEQLFEAAEIVKKAGAQFLRGGAYKPRTSPYAFQGLETEGLKYLAEARERTGLRVVTEVTTVEAIEGVVEYADMLQIGARNMQNFGLLKAVGQCDKPVLLKRGAGATVEELLQSAEYLLLGGNENVILCERGIRTFAKEMRFTLDLCAVPALKKATHLPVIVDPSHAAGRSEYVEPLALAAVAAGADGVMVEVHDRPAVAQSDGAQALSCDGFAALAEKTRALLAALRG